MLAVSIKLSKKRIAVIASCALLIGLIALSVFTGFNGISSAVNLGFDEADKIDYIKSFGWEIDQTSLETNDVVIPNEFNDVYNQYNKIQQQQGFDLTKYKGKTVTRYTFNVTNYPNYPDHVKINLLIYEGKVIGGDICRITLDGFIVAFK